MSLRLDPLKLSYGLSFALNSGYALIITLYPLILDDAGFSPRLIGLVFLSYNLFSAVLRFPSGYLILKYGNLWGIKLSCVLFLGAGISGILALGWGYPGYFITPILLGLAIAFYFPSQFALAAEVSGNILKAYATLNLLSGPAWILGTLIGGWVLERLSPLELFLIASGFMTIGLGLGLLLKGPPTSKISPDPKTKIKFPYQLAMVFLLTGASSGFLAISLPVYLNRYLGAGEARTGLILALGQAGLFFSQLPVSKLARHPIKNLYMSSLISSALLIGVLGWPRGLASVAALYLGYESLAGICWVTLDSVVAQKFAGYRALALGWSWAFWRIGYGVGSGMGGYIWEFMGIDLVYPLVGIILIAAGAIAARVL